MNQPARDPKRMPVGSSICITRIEDDLFVASLTCVDLNTLLPLIEPNVLPPMSGECLRQILIGSFGIEVPK